MSLGGSKIIRLWLFDSLSATHQSEVTIKPDAVLKLPQENITLAWRQISALKSRSTHLANLQQEAF